jgi:hypothetical protein
MPKSPLDVPYRFDVPDTRAPLRGRVWDPATNVIQPTTATLTWAEFTPQPWQLFAHVVIRFAAPDTHEATELTFRIERGLLTILRPRDRFYFCGSPWAAISIVRDGTLVAAAGAVHALMRIPLGAEVAIRYPASSDVKVPIPLGGLEPRPGPRPEGRARHATEITVDGVTTAWYVGRPTLGQYDIYLGPGFRDAEPWLSMERKRVCPETAAHTSSELLDKHRPHTAPNVTR